MQTADVLAYFAAVIAAMALVATVVILLIGFRISGDFASSKRRLDELERWRNGETRELDAVRAVTEVLRRIVLASYSSNVKVSTRLLLSLEAMDAFLAGSRDAARIFRGDIEGDWRIIQRYLQYLDVAKEGDVAELELKLKNVAGRYPDEITIEFLRHIESLAPDKAQAVLRCERERLLRSVRGVDAKLWTG